MKIIKFIYEDFKKDFIFIRDVCKGKIDLKKRTDEIYTEVKQDVSKKGFFSEFLKKNWFWFLFCIAVAVITWWFAGMYYSIKVNEIIISMSQQCKDGWINTSMFNFT